ncbi:hypothetical protein FRB96_005145 [Tulasnella sp. 330]|nr:hypothetical protein FRB96_005145 [Tulasnella sp. 330]
MPDSTAPAAAALGRVGFSHNDTTAVVMSPKPAEKTTTVPTPEKGKGKGKAVDENAMEEDDEEEEEDDEEDDDGDDDEDMEEDVLEAVDTSVILPPGTRRSTRAKVDYTSPEAIAKAGVAKTDDDENEDSFTMKDD